MKTYNQILANTWDLIPNPKEELYLKFRQENYHSWCWSEYLLSVCLICNNYKFLNESPFRCKSEMVWIILYHDILQDADILSTIIADPVTGLLGWYFVQTIIVVFKSKPELYI